jgi:hypothetical protein
MRTPDKAGGRGGPKPGDDIVPDAAVVMDRDRILPAPARDVWPWIVQLGKDRAGWYMPRSGLQIRLRTNQLGRRFPRATETMADAIDRLTVALLFAGLRERVR